MKRVGQKIIDTLKNGGVGVMPTDTIYGLVGSALSKKAVERIYKLKKRSDSKPFIILISGIKDLDLFGVRHMSDICLTPFWPGPVSVILKCSELKKGLSYLRPLNKTLAFRCPKDKRLNNLLKEIGPLVVPSANIEGLPSAETIKQAREYFSDRVDFYFDVGTIKGAPSTLIALKNGKIKVLRKGKANINEE